MGIAGAPRSRVALRTPERAIPVAGDRPDRQFAGGGPGVVVDEAIPLEQPRQSYAVAGSSGMASHHGAPRRGIDEQGKIRANTTDISRPDTRTASIPHWT